MTSKQIKSKEDSRIIIFFSTVAFTLFCIWHFSNLFWSILFTYWIFVGLFFMFIYGAGEQNKREDEAVKKFDKNIKF